MIKSDLVRAMNESYAKLQLEAARVEELPIELEQLRRAIEAANRKVDFDVDPSDFRAALLDVAAGAKDD
ncbi:MAG TPA: hypothetical protein VF949_08985 [Reyranella sp.]|jgi:hypothetical protein